VTIATSLGNIIIRLRADVAPRSSAMFGRLVRSGLYNGCIFYRAEDFCIQGGLRTADGQMRSNPFGHFPFEYSIRNKRGTVTLARWEDVNSATGEFFINVKDSPHLDRTGTTGWGLGFAVFGEVQSGMDVADKIAALPTQSQGGMSMLVSPVSFQARATSPKSSTDIRSSAQPAFPFLLASPARLNVDIDQIGRVPVKLLPANAPKTVAALRSLAQHGMTGRLHRAEGIPPPPSRGPPYALVQATLDDPERILSEMLHEGSVPIGRGSVCMIPGSSDLFVSLGDHAGWETSMTVIGQVEPLVLETVVMPILQLPHHDFKHPTFGTVMSMLDAALPLRMSVDAGDSNTPQPTDPEEVATRAAGWLR